MQEQQKATLLQSLAEMAKARLVLRINSQINSNTLYKYHYQAEFLIADNEEVWLFRYYGQPMRDVIGDSSFPYLYAEPVSVGYTLYKGKKYPLLDNEEEVVELWQKVHPDWLSDDQIVITLSDGDHKMGRLSAVTVRGYGQLMCILGLARKAYQRHVDYRQVQLTDPGNAQEKIDPALAIYAGEVPPTSIQKNFCVRLQAYLIEVEKTLIEVGQILSY